MPQHDHRLDCRAADVLVGGLGQDELTGGASDDRSDYNNVNESGVTSATRDRILDFVQGSDRIDLATIDADTTIGGNQTFAFISAAAFSGIAGELRVTTGATTTLIQGDVNGDAVADFHIQLEGLYTLTGSNFVR